MPDELMGNLEPVPWSGCWIWMGKLTDHGYPYVPGDWTIHAGHRLAYAIANGRPPKEYAHVCHHCDTPACMNPAHLFVGTYRENMRDARHKNRMAKKLKGEAMATALSMVASGRHGYDEIARAVGAHPSAISNLVKRIGRYRAEKNILPDSLTV